MEGTGVVYCLTIADANRVTQWLRRRGHRRRLLHGRRPTPRTASRSRPRCASNRVKVVVATSALGMGYDKPDLAFVVHFQSPGSPIAYYQQIGRAGRALDDRRGRPPTGHRGPRHPGLVHRDRVPRPGRGRGRHRLPRTTRTGPSSVGGHRADREPAAVPPRGHAQGPRGRRRRRPRRRREVDPHRPRRGPTTPSGSSGSPPQRRREQAAMDEFGTTDGCLMQFLLAELDDPASGPCGRCGNCAGRSPRRRSTRPRSARAIDVRPAPAADHRAPQAVAVGHRTTCGAGSRAEQLVEEGRALCLLERRRLGHPRARRAEGRGLRRRAGRRRSPLVDGWAPEPAPTWVTVVPSADRPEVAVVRRAPGRRRSTCPSLPSSCRPAPRPRSQDEENSAQQVRNVLGAFAVDGDAPERPGPAGGRHRVDSRWTLTVVGALLREHGAAEVFPLVLAQR